MKGRAKSLKRLRAGRKRRHSDPIRPENMGEDYIKRVMQEVDRQAPLDLSKAGKKFKNLMESKRAGSERDPFEIQFQQLTIDKKNRVISSPLSPETASALEGITTIVGDRSTLSEEEFLAQLEQDREVEDLSSTLRRTIYLERLETKTENETRDKAEGASEREEKREGEESNEREKKEGDEED